jgi:hypothetical protein
MDSELRRLQRQFQEVPLDYALYARLLIAYLRSHPKDTNLVHLAGELGHSAAQQATIPQRLAIDGWYSIPMDEALDSLYRRDPRTLERYFSIVIAEAIHQALPFLMAHLHITEDHQLIRAAVEEINKRASDYDYLQRIWQEQLQRRRQIDSGIMPATTQPYIPELLQDLSLLRHRLTHEMEGHRTYALEYRPRPYMIVEAIQDALRPQTCRAHQMSRSFYSVYFPNGSGVTSQDIKLMLADLILQDLLSGI